MTQTSLTAMVEAHLKATGNWQHVPVEHLQWVDLRAKRLGDGRAMHVGDAVRREIAYEASGQ
jgi:hypothetical protein